MSEEWPEEPSEAEPARPGPSQHDWDMPWIEAIGSALVLAVVVGSRVMGDRLSGGMAGVTFLVNTAAVGCVFVSLLLTFGPISGGHFNPGHKQHGFMVAEGMHAGDLPNLDVPANGKIRFEYFDPHATLSGENTVFDADGSAVVVHAKADDYKSQPSGDAGDRVACGVLEKK